LTSGEVPTNHRPGPGRARAFAVGLLALLALGVAPAGATAQRALVLGTGDTLTFPLDTLRRMMTDARRLQDLLELDPHVVYYTGFGPPATLAAPAPAYPWIAVRLRSDSAVDVVTPGNLREMARAYANYAVQKMESVRREGPATGCEQVVSREVRRVSSFLDGWIVSRTLYGGPPFAPMDAMAFARAAGHLPAMLVDLGDAELVGCRDSWEQSNSDRLDAYRTWRRTTPGAAAVDSAAVDTTTGSGPGAPADTPAPADTAGGRSARLGPETSG
jgi:hypothetical protein